MALGLSYAWFGDVQSVFMPAVAHGARLPKGRLVSRAGLGSGLAVAGLNANIHFVLSVPYVWFYRRGILPLVGAGGMALMA